MGIALLLFLLYFVLVCNTIGNNYYEAADIFCTFTGPLPLFGNAYRAVDGRITNRRRPTVLYSPIFYPF